MKRERILLIFAVVSAALKTIKKIPEYHTSPPQQLVRCCLRKACELSQKDFLQYGI
jgi:hypothetical protein